VVFPAKKSLIRTRLHLSPKISSAEERAVSFINALNGVGINAKKP
jgi:hypothetical protein